MSGTSTIVLLTGANAGIGYAVAKVMTTESAQYHVIMAGRSPEKVKAAAEELQAAGLSGTVSTLILDVTDEASIQRAVEEVRSQFGRVDVLINNAGVASTNPNMKKQLEETFAANTIGPVIVTEAFKPLISKSSQPRVIHVTSGLGSLSRAADKSNPAYNEGYTVYRMSKAALNMYMIQNIKELEELGVKVYAVCPGLVRSNLRGTGKEQISAGGRAGDPEVSGRLILDVMEGRRDADYGKVMKGEGIWDW